MFYDAINCSAVKYPSQIVLEFCIFFARFNFLSPDYYYYHYIIGFFFIFVGALLWWFMITYFVNKVRSHFNVRSMWLVNLIIGFVILIMSGFGFVMGIKDYITAIL